MAATLATTYQSQVNFPLGRAQVAVTHHEPFGILRSADLARAIAAVGLVVTWRAHLGLPPNTEASMTCPPCFRSWLFLAVSLVFVAPSIAGAQGIEKPRIPLMTALDEIRDLREAYADAFNRKDTVTVVGMYAPDAIVIQADGSVLVGKDAIRKSMGAEAPTWPHMTINSDSVRVVGHTAWDIGTTHSQDAAGGEQVSHYLVVLRRGLKYWKVNSVAVVPETPAANAAH
ncbi:MAG: YybH family protein [Gemmatimonadales bacterium]